MSRAQLVAEIEAQLGSMAHVRERPESPGIAAVIRLYLANTA